jgi:hypothetical protein
MAGPSKYFDGPLNLEMAHWNCKLWGHSPVDDFGPPNPWVDLIFKNYLHLGMRYRMGSYDHDDSVVINEFDAFKSYLPDFS